MVCAPPEYPGKKYRDRYVYEHHLVWWRETGRLVPSGFVLHHKDEQKRHNVFSNLEIKSVAAHVRDHNAVEDAMGNCGWCGKAFWIKPCKLRMRLKKSASGKVFCGRSHAGRRRFDSSPRDKKRAPTV
jgi:hypothetical protein